MGGLPRATTAPHVRGGLPGIGSAIGIFRDPYGWRPRQYAAHGPVFRLTLPIEGGTWIVIGGRGANAPREGGTTSRGTACAAAGGWSPRQAGRGARPPARLPSER